MNFLKLKSQFMFFKQQRVGILILIISIFLFLLIRQSTYFNNGQSTFEASTDEVTQLQLKIDSLRFIEIAQRQPKIYPFNPNFISEFKAYTLGLTPYEFDRLKKYRESEKWINSKKDFKTVTQVSDSLLEMIAPYFKFPDWITNSKHKGGKYKSQSRVRTASLDQLDLNTATAEQLQQVNGVGAVLSQRIIKFRKQLGAFSNDSQLYAVWGLKPKVVQRILLDFSVKNTKTILKININNATASDLATIPGVSFELGKEIWEFVRLRDGLSNLSELTKLEQITSHKLDLIELYLYAK